MHRPETKAKLEEITDLMRRGMFRTGETYKALSARWGLSRKYTRVLTAEASRRVRAEQAAAGPVDTSTLPAGATARSA